MNFFKIPSKLQELMKDYIILDIIGSGASANVYLATNTISNQFCAIKVIDFLNENRERFEQEVKIMKEFDNPFIVKIYEYFQIENTIAIVMEYVPKGSLKDVIMNNGYLSEKYASTILIELVIAIQDMNKKGLIHRDIKIDNILVDNNGHIRLTDFGLSKFCNPNEALYGTACGSPMYTSPEVILRYPYSAKTDIWSVGIVLYTMLVGNYPFASTNIQQLFQLIVDGEVEYPSFLSTEAVDLMMHLLDKNQETRYSCIDVLNHPFISLNNPNAHQFFIKFIDYIADLNEWNFPDSLKKASSLLNIHVDKLAEIINSKECNSKTAVFKLVRNEYITRLLKSLIGSEETNFKPNLSNVQCSCDQRQIIFKPQRKYEMPRIHISKSGTYKSKQIVKPIIRNSVSENFTIKKNHKSLNIRYNTC
ncbi:CAMK family protein kinase [Tritrichomonas foetus]|uniref:CAMK family protein kinase n=1 Tax=Tritrichomonas foetus TaxID=1144522 RepID=A0A1J4KPY0_9EUKA|nr:CAMK family protein kinase [Tritrichomonas foetus]|eukprot:OHT13299.1 CAMK family protein kinase [Tritrichomonas foetus]